MFCNPIIFVLFRPTVTQNGKSENISSTIEEPTNNRKDSENVNKKDSVKEKVILIVIFL